MGFLDKILKKTGLRKKRDWDGAYRSGKALWDSGVPSAELVKALSAGDIKPGRALELGCGTGTNSIFLAERGFEVTGVDNSDEALATGREKLTKYYEKKSRILSVQFDKVKIPDFKSNVKYNFVFDRGCFHTFPKRSWQPYAQMVANLLQSGSYYLLLTGNDKEPRDPGPPVLSEKQIRDVFLPDFNIIRIKDFRFNLKKKNADDGALGHSCLMTRK
ncbi:MAG: class I SAM-dependent methyltransferase [Leptospirales bacterium]